MDYRERIITEAASLFMKYGIRSVTMDDIAHQLGISKRTIYENFSDKDELLTDVIKSMVKKQKESFRRALEGSENVIEALFEILRIASFHFDSTSPTLFMDLKKYHYKIYELAFQKGDIRNYEITMLILQRGVEEKIFRSDINLEIVNAGVHGLLDAARNHDALPPMKYSKYELADNLFFSFLFGISTPEGRELINSYKKQKRTELNY